MAPPDDSPQHAGAATPAGPGAVRMPTKTGASPPPDLRAANAVLQQAVDGRLLPGVSAVVLRNGVEVNRFCTGLADIEAGTRLRHGHIHRAYSNTKLVVAVLVLRLVDQGVLALDAPVARWLPALAGLRVLKAGARRLQDTEPLNRPITLRHLLSHQAGFSHGVFDPGSLLFEAYAAAGVRKAHTSLAELVEAVAGLPLNYQPGEGWDYSMAPDLLARVVEVATGQTLGEALATHVLGPLGMVDTGFVLSPEQRPRLAAQYVGDLQDPRAPGLTRVDHLPYPGAYLSPFPRQSGAGGLFTTEADMLALLRALRPGAAADDGAAQPGSAQPGAAFLSPALLAEAFTDQLPPGRRVNFANMAVPDLGFCLLGAVARTAGLLQHPAAVGDVQWGGLAGTHWWVHPAKSYAGVLMTQRFMGFWNPFWHQYRAALYQAIDAVS